METYIKKDIEIFTVKDQKIEVVSEFKFNVETNEKVFDRELDNKAINKAFNIYREKNDIITSEEIKSIREYFNLSQRAFALITGLGKATIIRYESGAIPTKINSNFIKDLKTNPTKMLELFNSTKEKLDVKTQTKFLCRIEEIENNNNKSDSAIVKTIFEDDVENINNGFHKFNINKIIQVISFFANEISMLSKTKLNKLLFYSDFSFFDEFTTSITGMTYIHDHYGPVPKRADMLYGILSDEEKIHWHLFPNGQGEFITSDEKVVDLNKDELKVLRKVLLNFQKDNAERISNKSHEERAWIETNPKEIISYEYANTLIYK